MDEFYISQNLSTNVQYLTEQFKELKTKFAEAKAKAKAKANANAWANANARAQADKGGPLGLEWNERGQDPNANARAQAARRAQAAGGGRKKTYTVAILKEKLRKQGKAISGTKAELEKRLSL